MSKENDDLITPEKKLMRGSWITTNLTGGFYVKD
jgi:hypothetical protein